MDCCEPTFSENVPKPEIVVEVGTQRIKFHFVVDGWKIGEFSFWAEILKGYTTKDWDQVVKSLSNVSKNGDGIGDWIFANRDANQISTMIISPYKNSISMRAYKGLEENGEEIIAMTRVPFQPFLPCLIAAFQKISKEWKSEKN